MFIEKIVLAKSYSAQLTRSLRGAGRRRRKRSPASAAKCCSPESIIDAGLGYVPAGGRHDAEKRDRRARLFSRRLSPFRAGLGVFAEADPRTGRRPDRGWIRRPPHRR